MNDLKKKANSYWQQKLTPQQYHVVREKGTEAPFSGEYLFNSESGMYQCIACGQDLFSSQAKFDSDCGWPTFDDPVGKVNVELKPDHSLGMERTEVLCSNCGAHLGHVFDDGPKNTTGKRYCINSLALNFKKE